MSHMRDKVSIDHDLVYAYRRQACIRHADEYKIRPQFEERDSKAGKLYGLKDSVMSAKMPSRETIEFELAYVNAEENTLGIIDTSASEKSLNVVGSGETMRRLPGNRKPKQPSPSHVPGPGVTDTT